MSRPNEAGQPAHQFQLKVLGPPYLGNEAGVPVPGLGPGKPLAMLAYLVFHDSVRRDELIGLLWGDVAEGKARNAFRQTLHRLRSALGEDIIASEQDQIVLRAGGRLWCDAIEFRQAIAAREVDRAIEIYGGDFLAAMDVREHEFSDWVEDERRRFRASYEGALTRAAEQSLDAGSWQLAVERAQLLTRSAPLDGNAAVLEATALLAAGRRAEAITALTVHTKRMETELGAKASATVSSMLQEMLNSAPRTDENVTRKLGSDAVMSGRPEFVGREKELTQLLAAWRRATSGEGSGIVITGESGVGKSRLVGEFLSRAPAIASPLTLSGQERAAAVSIPYASIAEALRPALAAPGLAGASQHLLAEAARLLPELRDQFDLPAPAALRDDTERVRFFEGIAALIDAVSYEQPVCIVLEDLHQASGSTVELVRYLARRLRASPVLIVATWSRAEGAGAIAGFDQIDVRPLSLEDSERLLNTLLDSGEVSDDDRRRLAGLSGGFPMRAIALAERAREGEIASAALVPIRDVLWRRLQDCTPHEQRLFVAAALFTRAVTIRLLAAAAHVSESAALEGALSLERHGLLAQRDGRMTPTSAAAADLALETTGAAGLTLLAGWAADALAADRTAPHGELARLYALADRKPEAYHHARSAALDAAACGAPDEAQRFLDVAASSSRTEEERAEVATLARSFGSGGTFLLPGDIPPGRATDSTSTKQPDRADANSKAAETSPNEGGRRFAALLPPLRVRRWFFIAGGLAVVAAVTWRTRLDEQMATRGNVLSDTLVLAERLGPRELRYFIATGSLSEEVRSSADPGLQTIAPRWIDSLSLPWVNPLVSPSGDMIALERVTPAGVDVYIIGAVARDTLARITGRGDHIAEGWSPDGSRLLVSFGHIRPDGTYDSDLYSYGVSPGMARVALDTAADRSILEARWSPRGTAVAWVARAGETRQRDVFVGFADGSRARNLGRHPAEDYDLAWSPDGERVAFTSERDGNAEIYAAEVATGQLRRLTFDPAQDNRPAYSPDGQFLAFESTRGGRLGAYVMTAFAGTPRPLLAGPRRLELVKWQGETPPFVQRLAIRLTAALAPGDSSLAWVEATDQNGREIRVTGIRWTSLDPVVVQLRSLGDTTSSARLTAERPGLARIVADLGGWRTDTAFVEVGSGGRAPLRDGFESAGLSNLWIPLGIPKPFVADGVGRAGSRGVVLNGGARWESGVLSTAAIPIQPGLAVQAWIRAPFASARPMPATATISLVAADPGIRPDPVSPQFLPLAAISWAGDAARVTYSIEGEVRTETMRSISNANEHLFRISIDESGRAAFYVDGKLRWRSSVSLSSAGEERRVQLWIGARRGGDGVVVDDVEFSPGASGQTVQRQR